MEFGNEEVIWQIQYSKRLGCIFEEEMVFRRFTVKKIGDGLKDVKTNLRFFGLSLSFYSSF